MTKRYYVELDGGTQDTDLTNIRRKAIDYLWFHPRERSVTVYTSHLKKLEVGTVYYTKSRPLFLWTLSNGKSRPLFRDGNVYRK